MTFVVWFIYDQFFKQWLFDRKSSIPNEFRTSFQCISDCFALHDTNHKQISNTTTNVIIGNCFTTNKGNMLSISKNIFTPLAHKQFEQFVFTYLKIIL